MSIANKRGLSAEEAKRFRTRRVRAANKLVHKEGMAGTWEFISDQHELAWILEYIVHPFSMGDVAMYDPLCQQGEKRTPWYDALGYLCLRLILAGFAVSLAELIADTLNQRSEERKKKDTELTKMIVPIMLSYLFETLCVIRFFISSASDYNEAYETGKQPQQSQLKGALHIFVFVMMLSTFYTWKNPPSEILQVVLVFFTLWATDFVVLFCTAKMKTVTSEDDIEHVLEAEGAVAMGAMGPEGAVAADTGVAAL